MTASRPHPPTVDAPPRIETPDPGDLALIDEMLSLTPQQRLSHLEETLRSLERLLAATGTTIPAE